MLLVHADLPRTPQVPSHNRIRQQLLLEYDTELKRQVGIQHWYIECRAVVHGIHVWFACVDLSQPDHSERGKNRLHDRLRPCASKCMKLAAIFVEETERDGSDTEKDRVGPDQQIEK